MAYRHYHHHHHHHGHHEGDSGLGCILMLVIGILAMPIVGFYLLVASSDEETKVLGTVLLVIGAIVWIFALANGA